MIIVDQLEELFTQEQLPQAEREAFVTALEALANSGLVWVVAMMRSDFFDRLERLPALAALSAGGGRYLLLPPDEAEIGQIIRRPAREAGLRFETEPARAESLDDVILHTTGCLLTRSKEAPHSNELREPLEEIQMDAERCGFGCA